MAPSTCLIMALMLVVACGATGILDAVDQIKSAYKDVVSCNKQAKELGDVLIDTAGLCKFVGPPFSTIAAPCLSLVGSFLGGHKEDSTQDGVGQLKVDVRRLAAHIDKNFKMLGVELDQIERSVAAIRNDVEVLYEDVHLHLSDLVALDAAFVEYMTRINSARTDAADLADAHRFALGSNDRFSLDAYTLFSPENVNQVLSWTLDRTARGPCPQAQLIDGALLFHRIITARFQLFTIQSGAMMLEHGRADSNTIQYANRLHEHISTYVNISGAARYPVDLGFENLQKKKAQCCTARLAVDHLGVLTDVFEDKSAESPATLKSYLNFLIDCCCRLDCSKSPPGMEASCPCSPGGVANSEEASRSCLGRSHPPVGRPVLVINASEPAVLVSDGFVGDHVHFLATPSPAGHSAAWTWHFNGVVFHPASHLCLNPVKMILWWCADSWGWWLEPPNFHFALNIFDSDSVSWLPVVGESGPFCLKDTGGTCQALSCDDMRNGAACFNGQCLCPQGSCAVASGYDTGTCWKTGKANTSSPYCLKDTGGTCQVFDCSDIRGNASCDGGSCICNPGYCATEKNYATGMCVKAGMWNGSDEDMEGIDFGLAAQADAGGQANVAMRRVQAGLLFVAVVLLVSAYKLSMPCGSCRSQHRPPPPELAQPLCE